MKTRHLTDRAKSAAARIQRASAGRRERRVPRTQAIEDAGMRRATFVRGALGCVVVAMGLLLTAAPAQASLGISEFKVEAIDEGGVPDLQAGSHPWELTTSVAFNLEPGGAFTEGDPRDLHLEAPPGLIENPAAIAQCAATQFQTPRSSPFEASRSGESCPDKSQLGVATLETSLGTRSFGLYNLVPPPGVPSQIGFAPYGIPVTLTPHIRQAGGEYGITLDLRNLTQSFDLRRLELTVWGTPWNITHNTERGNCLNEADAGDPWGKCSVGRPAHNPAEAYLTLPPSCNGPPTTTLAADSWQQPGSYLPDGEPDLSDPAWATASAAAPRSQVGCDLLPFSPAAKGFLSSDRAASAAGYDLEFEISEAGLTDPLLIAPSQPRKAVVALPPGVSVNPSVAAGLGVCAPSQYAAETASSPPGAGCPNASKIGTFTVQSPLYAEPVAGSLFLAAPHENPFGSLLALYIVAKAPSRGIIVKVAGSLEADPASGGLTATFEGLPQLPYTHFDVHFREGRRSPLLSPPSCGAYATQIALTPWLEDGPTVQISSPQQIAHGPEGTACPSGTPPFHPGATAGEIGPSAGTYSPFYLHLTRGDTEAEITSYSAQLPPGLLANLSDVSFCPDAAIEAAKHTSGVFQEAHPSCPASSQIGHTYTGYGVGSVLAYAPGGLYLAGPFHGAPLSIVAIDAATVGPFDLGTIVIRSAIDIDPHTAQVTVDSAASDPIPHILDGIPLHLRDIRVYIDRPGFTLNPTSCEPFSVVSALTGTYAPFTNPRAETASVPVRFQDSGCSALGFSPRFSLKLAGGTRRGQFPSLRATYRPRPGQANVASAAVTMPRTEFLAQEHIGTVCTKPHLEAETCPKGSAYGKATAITPLLAEPMRGPVYLVTGFGHKLPDLVAVIHGLGVRIVLDGRIDTKKGGLRGTFSGLPDAPVTTFTLKLFGGRHGVLANERNLCAAPQLAAARFLSQGNRGFEARPQIATDCRKKARHHRGHHHRGGKGR
jgi:hypothetical protein